MDEIQYIICSYINFSKLLQIVDYQTIDRVLKRYPQELSTIEDICEDDMIEELKYLVYLGYKVDTNELEDALGYKSIDVIKYLCSLGIKPQITEYLLSMNGFDMLIYLDSLGVKFGEEILDRAFDTGYFLLVKYLVGAGYTGSPDFIRCINTRHLNTCNPCFYHQHILYLIDHQIIKLQNLLEIAVSTDNEILVEFLNN